MVNCNLTNTKPETPSLPTVQFVHPLKESKNEMTKIFALFLLMTAVLSFSACHSQNQNQEGTGETRTVEDVWGRAVKIPVTVKSIICLGSGAPRLAAYLNAVDMMVGNESHDASDRTVLRDYNIVHYETLKKLPLVGAGGGGGSNNGYPEAIIMAAPDVILATFSPDAADELFSQTGIPVVCVRHASQNFVDETFYNAMRVFAEVIGAQERCEEVLSFIDDCKKDLNERTIDILDHQKLKSYIGAVNFKGRHGFAGTYANFGPLMGINAINVADEFSAVGFFQADLEKVLLWDPDVIFLDPGNMDMVHSEYSTNPNYFKSLRAIQEGRVYTMPSFNGNGTNITYALMNAYYAGTVLFPEQFADVDIAEKSAEILTFFLGKDTFPMMVDGGLYYGKITMGE